MTRVVLITPVRLEADSRTFKQAASLARFSYDTIVVEGETSTLDRRQLPFRLLSLPQAVRGFDLESTPDAPSGRPELPEPSPATAARWPRRAVKALVKRARRLLRPLPERRKIQIVSLAAIARYVASYYWRYGARPARHIPPASLYILHCYLHFPAVYLLTRRLGVPFIYDAHDFYASIENADERSRALRWLVDPLHRWVERRCMRHADDVVTVSDGVRALQLAAYGRGGVVIRNCQDARLDRSLSRSLRDTLGLARDDFLLVTVGQAKKGQAIAEAIEAMRGLPDTVHLAFVGRGYEAYLRDLEGTPVAARLHAVPPVQPDEVVPFIRSADAALILYYARSPNYEHCLPNGFFQSLAASLPILYPELPELRRLATDHGFGLSIDARDPASIRSAVCGLLRDRSLRDTLRERSARAAEQLSWEREEQTLRELVERVLQRPTPAVAGQRR